MTMLDCEVCHGTGKYAPEDISALWTKYYKNRKTKGHRCEGSCRKCGQFFDEEDFTWLKNQLDRMEKLMIKLHDKITKRREK